MKREMPEIIEIPQPEPDGLQKFIFWLALNRKKASLFLLGALLAASLLIFWKTPSDNISEKITLMKKGLSEISVEKGDLSQFQKLQKLSSHLGALKESLLMDLYQKQLLFSKDTSLLPVTMSQGEGFYRDFSEVSLLLAKQQKEEALAKTIALEKKLENTGESSAKTLLPYNLFRLYQIYANLGKKEKAREILVSLKEVLQTPKGQEFAAQFSRNEVSLAQWLKQRETP